MELTNFSNDRRQVLAILPIILGNFLDSLRSENPSNAINPQILRDLADSRYGKQRQNMFS